MVPFGLTDLHWVTARIDSFKAATEFAVEELPRRWQEPACRRRASMAFGIFVFVLLLCRVPLSENGPIVDVTAFSARAGSQILDAVGLIHCLNCDDLTLRQPGQSANLRGIAGIGLPATVMFLGSFLWAMVRRPSEMLFWSVTACSVVMIVVANTFSLALVMLVGGAAGIPIATGVGWLFTIAVQLAVSIGLLVSFYKTFELTIARWKLWAALRQTHEIRELPPPAVVATSRFQPVAACLLASFLLTWLFGAAVTKETLISTYRDTANRSLNNYDDETARIAVERLLQLDPQSAPHRFLQAQLHERAGRIVQAESIVRDVAQSNGRRFEPAHRWLADLVARQRKHVAEPSTNEASTSISQLNHATRLDPANVNAHVALAESYLARRSPQQAIRELEQVVDQRPDLRLTLARLAVMSGQTDLARRHSETARQFYQKELVSLPLSRDARMQLAASQVFLEEFAEAAGVLQKGWELTRDETYQRSLGDLYLMWHDADLRRGAGRPKRLSLLETSLKHAPDNAETLRRVALMATQEEPTGPAIDLLTRALADRPIPASVHLTLGTNAYAKGRLANALRHLEEAHRLDPHDVQTLNNLACVLSESFPPALERALQLVNDAIARDPHRAPLRETRGQILAKMGRWSPAIADLETAMQVMQDHPGIHATLAEGYERLGDVALADEHRRRVN